ncbi:oligosaccharide flippase family protein [Svornostia abyssi]|uniref:Oligosaccharide flippase family protein n=1 Tax=Svornostia abyssi TaxID=2898438 RepID=A0ABY5PEM3_9ACTN|nr:oligosaccharide flippase family protein [Parviterribacteraceae bacterium J379]
MTSAAASGGGRREALDSLASSVVLQGLVLVSGVIAARILGPTDRGLLALLWVVALSITQFGTFGVPQAVTYELARGGATVAVLARRAWWIVLGQAVGLTAIQGLALLTLTTSEDMPATPALISLAVLPAMVAHLYALGVVQGLKRFRMLHVCRLLPSAAYTSVLVVGVVAGARSLEFVTAAWVISYAASAAVTVSCAFLATRAGPTGRGGLASDVRARTLVSFGAAGLLGTVSPTETFRVDQLIVGVVLSPAELGLYVSALAFCNLPRFLAQGLGLVAYPRLAETDDPLVQRRLLWRYTALGTAAAAVVAIPLSVFAEPLIRLTFGREFVGAASVAQILLAGTVVLCARRVMSDCLRGVGAPSAGSYAEAFSWVWLIPALVVLVPPYGVDGVALALAISYVLSAGLLIWIAERRGLGIRPR